MFLNSRKFLMSALFAVMLLPMMAFASSEFKGTETVNINKADAATLSAYLKGVGPSKAKAIVKYRSSNGKFKSVSDLKNVPGIGEETVKSIKSKISTSRGKSTAPKGYKMGASSSKSSSTKKKSSSSAKKTSSKKSSSASDKSSSTKSTSSKDKKVASTKKKSSSKKKSSAKKDDCTSSKDKDCKKKAAKKKTTKKKTTKKKPVKKKVKKEKKK